MDKEEIRDVALVVCQGADECKHTNRFGNPCAHKEPHTPFSYGCVESHETFRHCKYKDFRCVLILCEETKEKDRE